MRVSACVLITVGLSWHVSANQENTAAVDQRDEDPESQQTLIATIFDEPLYLEQVTPANAETKRGQLPAAEFSEWLRQYRGRRTYQTVWRAVLRRYVERQQIEVTDQEMAAIAESIERRLQSSPELPADTTFTPGERKGMMVAWARASLMDWKVCKSLYETYGGRVGIGSLGSWTAFDGQNALLQEHYEAGDFEFQHAETEAAFWQHTRITNFADAYPQGERLKQLLARPPYLRDRTDGEQGDPAELNKADCE